MQKVVQIGADKGLNIGCGHAQRLCHASDDVGNGQGAFIGFGKDLTQGHLAECFGIEMLAKGDVEPRFHQGLHHACIAAKAMNGAGHVMLAPPPHL